MIRHCAAALALACLFTAGLAHAATLTATPATLSTQLAAALPGDIVELAAGDYGDLAAKNLAKAAPGVTIRPAAGAAVAVSSITASGSTNLTFTGLEVQAKPATQYALTVAGGGAGVVFDQLKVHQVDGKTPVGVGAFIRNAAGVTIQNSEFAWLGVGVTVMDSDHVTVAGNELHDIAVDGMDLAGASDVLVSKNYIHDFHPGEGAHPDAIQFWATALHPDPARITITGNRYVRGTGGVAQGIFGGPGEDVTITDNALRGPMYNGISLAGTKGATISGNFVDGYPDMATRIIVRGGCDQVAITGNAAQAVVNYVVASEAPCTNVTISGNTALQPAAFGDDALLTAWRTAKGAAPIVTPPPPADPLQATVDSLKTQVTALQGQATASAQQAGTAQAALATVQQQVSSLQAKIAAAQAALQ